MENFRISAGMLVIYLLMLTLDARGQDFNNPVFVRPGETIHSGHQVAQVIKIYTSQIGVREKNFNSGREVEKYLRYVNLPKGNPWCAAFVCWVYGEAGVGNPRSGWSPDLFGEGRVIWRRGEQGTKSKPAWPVGREQGLGAERPYRFSSSSSDGRGLCAQCPPLAEGVDCAIRDTGFPARVTSSAYIFPKKPG